MSLIGPLLGDPVAAGDAVAALRRYSLVIPAGDGLVLMHRLVQAVTRAQLTAETASQWKQGAKALVDTAVPADTHLPATWPACAVLLPVRERVLGPEHLDTLVTRHEIAHWAGEAGNAAGARDQLTVLLPITERVMGPKHYRTFTVRAELAHWVTEAGDAPPDVS